MCPVFIFPIVLPSIKRYGRFRTVRSTIKARESPASRRRMSEWKYSLQPLPNKLNRQESSNIWTMDSYKGRLAVTYGTLRIRNGRVHLAVIFINSRYSYCRWFHVWTNKKLWWLYKHNIFHLVWFPWMLYVSAHAFRYRNNWKTCSWSLLTVMTKEVSYY